MENTDILFWIITIPTLSMFVAALRSKRAAGQGWILVCLTVLIVLFFAWLRRNNSLTYLAALLWAVFILLPHFFAGLYTKRLFEQDFASARRYARAVSILHPLDGWREQPRIIHALELAQKGQTDAAIKILHEFQNATSPAALVAMVNLYRITHRWEDFCRWAKQQSHELENDPTFLPTILRARGEIGDLHGMLQLYAKNKSIIARLSATNSDLCRLVLFAFCGRRDLVEQLFDSGLGTLPEGTKDFWLTTADLTAGKTDVARQNFETQIRSADPWNRRAIERRLSTPLPIADSLDPAQLQIISDAALEHTHEQIFDAAPPFSEARATRILILLNIAIFILEIRSGGATNGNTLEKLGAVVPELVRHGQWWRLWASLFLHYGAIHIAMNMINLSVIGPFVEGAFGYFRFLVVYFLSGVGSMFVVMTLSRHGIPTVGASGAIMGLVGATGGLMFKGWLHHRASPAKRRLTAILMIVAVQTIFDALIPQVSMTAHLSGAVIGFVTALILPSKLKLDA